MSHAALLLLRVYVLRLLFIWFRLPKDRTTAEALSNRSKPLGPATMPWLGSCSGSGLRGTRVEGLGIWRLLGSQADEWLLLGFI